MSLGHVVYDGAREGLSSVLAGFDLCGDGPSFYVECSLDGRLF